jgi:hypothetical protein
VNVQDLYEGLLETGYPVAYRQFKSAPELPYIVYLFATSADLMADNENYQGIGDYQVELYTQDKDLTSEAVVEASLKALRLPFGKTEAYLDTEDMYEVLYEVRIIETASAVS